MWVTIEDLEEFLGVGSDDNMQGALAASLDYCQRQRPDLDPTTSASASVAHAVLIYAGLLYRERSSPQGFATYEELPGMGDVGAAMSNVFRLLGSRRPVAK